MSENKLILFLKYPEPGQVKTRLASALGNEFALELYKCFISDISSEMHDVNAESIILYSGPDGISFPDFPDSRIIRQRGKDIGERMYNAFLDVFSGSAGKCVLTGSDVPDITAGLLQDAFNMLEHSDMVLGPSTDGGYYCIGFKRGRLNKSVFENVPWSTSRVFSETVKSINKAGLKAEFLSRLSDIDDFNDLKRFYKERKSEIVFSKTIKFLNSHQELINEI